MNCASWKAGQQQGAQPAGREPRPAIMLSGQLEAGVDGIDSRQPTAHNQLPLLRPAGTTRLPASGQLEARMDGHHAKGQVLVVNAAEASCLNHLQERVAVVAAVWASSRVGDSRRLIKAAAPQASRPPRSSGGCVRRQRAVELQPIRRQAAAAHVRGSSQDPPRELAAGQPARAFAAIQSGLKRHSPPPTSPGRGTCGCSPPGTGSWRHRWPPPCEYKHGAAR